LERKEAVALLKELGDKEHFEPLVVLVEQRKTNSYQLKIKGDYDLQLVSEFLKNRGFSYEENENYLLIFKH
jgi:hypothetical protein